MPAVLRCDQRPGGLAGGNGVHRTTVTRWVREVIGLLAARAPRLDRALKGIARMGGGIVLLDGSVVRTCHGLLVIALTDDRGRLLWISAARPGRTSEITACRHDKLTQKLREVGLGAIADLGFVGLDDGGPDADPAWATALVRALLVLTNRRSRPMTDDLHQSHLPATSTSIPMPTHTSPVTSNFSLHTSHWSRLFEELPGLARMRATTDPRIASIIVWSDVTRAEHPQCPIVRKERGSGNARLLTSRTSALHEADVGRGERFRLRQRLSLYATRLAAACDQNQPLCVSVRAIIAEETRTRRTAQLRWPCGISRSAGLGRQPAKPIARQAERSAQCQLSRFHANEKASSHPVSAGPSASPARSTR
ncbi:hypothetical protein ACFY9S_34510 [Streptomyces sp. NPDC012474]|uniref:hypothetical protein n=1 Tax=Streptomyces sp. NPDC012474 TaxID=3364836 RepID=UPI0036E0D7A7